MQLVATRTLTSRLSAPALSATPVSTSQINLSWTAPTPTGQSAIAGRRLYRATSPSGPWSEIASSGTSASASGLAASTPYYFYLEYYDQYQTGLPSSIVSATTHSPTSQKKWPPSWGVLLDNFADNATIRALHLNATFNQSQNTGHIIETATMPNVGFVKLLCYWGTLDVGETLASAAYDFSLIDQYLTRCAAAGKMLLLSIFPITFNNVDATAANGGRFFPRYISNNPTTYGITKLTVPGYMARTWRPAVNQRLIALHQRIAELYDDHPNFFGVQTEETSINVADGTDGFTYALYTDALKAQFDSMSAAFVRSQVRCSTNYFNGGDAAGQDIIAYAAARGIGCGGPDVLPNEVIAANRIFNGFTGGIDYRGPGPYGPGSGGANKTPWYSEIQLPEMGSGKEGDYTMQALYDCAMLGQGRLPGDGGTGGTTTVTGMKPMNPNFMIIYRNTSTPTAPDTFRLNWYNDIKPFINSHLGYGSNQYPVNQPQ